MNGHIHTTIVATYQTSNPSDLFHSRAGGHVTALINKGHLWHHWPILKHNTTCKVDESHMKAHFCPGV